MNKPLVSIVMPVYNADKYLKEAIESILVQTYTNYELIIIDDGSNDNTLKIVKNFNDSQIQLCCNNENKGICYSMNKGIDLSQGKYIARMDADDIAVENRLEKQVEFMESHPEITACGTNINFIINNKIKKNRNELFLNSAILKIHFLAACNIYNPTAIIRKDDIIESNLFYNVDTRLSDDYDYWLRLILIRNIANIPDKLLFYRVHKSSITQKNQKAWFEQDEILRFNYLLALGCDERSSSVLVKAASGKLESIEECKLFQKYYENFSRKIIANPNYTEKITLNRLLSYIYRVNAHLGTRAFRIYWENRFCKYKLMKQNDLHLFLKLFCFNFINWFVKIKTEIFK